jgi:type IV secretory pathway VirB2 component (pilin)
MSLIQRLRSASLALVLAMAIGAFATNVHAAQSAGSPYDAQNFVVSGNNIQP